MSGAISGVACSPIMSPMENIRIKMQVDKSGLYKNTFDCAKQIYKQYGIKGIYKGLNSTLYREVPGEGNY